MHLGVIGNPYFLMYALKQFYQPVKHTHTHVHTRISM